MKNDKTVKQNRQQVSDLSKAIATQTITLVTTAFGLVAALAWNEAIKEYVNVYIKPYFAKGSGVVSLFVYAIIITTFSVILTIQLTKLLKKIEIRKV